eukprot:778711-Prymnesium_polylepis.1
MGSERGVRLPGHTATVTAGMLWNRSNCTSNGILRPPCAPALTTVRTFDFSARFVYLEEHVSDFCGVFCIVLGARRSCAPLCWGRSFVPLVRCFDRRSVSYRPPLRGARWCIDWRS